MPTATAIPDLSKYRLIHAAMRAADDQLVAGIATCQPGNRRRAAALRRWFDGYAGELHDHHTIEDEIFFPALADRVPSYAEYAPVLTADHGQVDELIDGLRSTLAALPDAGDSWDTVRNRALTAAEELRDLLASHLDLEDADVLPLFERHFSAAEYDALDQRARESVRPRQLAFTVPWLIASADPEVAKVIVANAPRSLRLIWRATRGRYARLTCRAFGSGDRPLRRRPTLGSRPEVCAMPHE
jgi:hypothetical protein